MENIMVSGPSITEKEIAYVTDAVKNAWYENANIYNERFEKAFAKYIGRKYAISLPSCTSALHLALASLEIGPNDEVIVPDITWIASAAPISYVGATPVFADIDEKTWCLSVESFKKNISPKTKAVIVVDLYGNMPEMNDVLQIAKEYNIAVIEDAAEAIGSEYQGKKAGSFGDVSTFSFHGSKTMTTGEGGMLVTDREDIYQESLHLRDHGRVTGEKMFWNDVVAFKYKMSNMQAALGLAQLERIDELISKKREIFSWYQEELHTSSEVTLNYQSPNVINTYWMVTIIISSKLEITKGKVINLMAEKDISCRPFFYPLSSLPAYKETKTSKNAEIKNKVAYSIHPFGINLPCGMNMTENKVKYVCNNLKYILSR